MGRSRKAAERGKGPAECDHLTSPRKSSRITAKKATVSPGNARSEDRKKCTEEQVSAQVAAEDAPSPLAKSPTPKLSARKRKRGEAADSELVNASPRAKKRLKKSRADENAQRKQGSQRKTAPTVAKKEDAADTTVYQDVSESGVKLEKLEETETAVVADIKREEDKKPKPKRKTREEKEAEAMPLAARTTGLRMFIGAHVSCAKGIQNSIINSVHIGGNAFAAFLKSQRKWENPPLQTEHREQFKAYCIEHGYDAASHVLPHGSYLVNLAQADPEKATQAYAGFIDDLHRCEDLGIKYYNFHPGTTGGNPRPAAISRIAAALNKAISTTKIVVPLLETMATAGSNVIGSTFEDLRDIIAEVDDKDRIGVCLDTCHVFAAGYDLRQPNAFAETLTKFDNIVGMQYLKALHLNDSKAPLAAGRDLHQNIGLGFLGLRAFHNVVNEKRFENLPLILETPIDHKDENGKDIEDKRVWAREIKMLEGMIGMDADGDEFKTMERDLAEQGQSERAKYQEAFQRKMDKAKKGQTKLLFAKKSKKPTHSSDTEDGT